MLADNSETGQRPKSVYISRYRRYIYLRLGGIAWIPRSRSGLGLGLCVFSVCIEDYRALLSTLLVKKQLLRQQQQQQLQQTDNPRTTARTTTATERQLLQQERAHTFALATLQSRHKQVSGLFIIVSLRALVNFSRFWFGLRSDYDSQLQLQLTNDPRQQIGFYRSASGLEMESKSGAVISVLARQMHRRKAKAK